MGTQNFADLSSVLLVVDNDLSKFKGKIIPVGWVTLREASYDLAQPSTSRWAELNLRGGGLSCGNPATATLNPRNP
jgi:hypothetical protein